MVLTPVRYPGIVLGMADALSLDEALLELARICEKDFGYRPARFLQMFHEDGGLKTVQTLLAKNGMSYGLETLWEHRRLDLSIEALVLTQPWNSLFTDVERATARQRLAELGFKGRSFLVQEGYPG